MQMLYLTLRENAILEEINFLYDKLYLKSSYSKNMIKFT